MFSLKKMEGFMNTYLFNRYSNIQLLMKKKTIFTVALLYCTCMMIMTYPYGDKGGGGAGSIAAETS